MLLVSDIIWKKTRQKSLQKHPQGTTLFIKEIEWFRFHCEPSPNNLKKIHFCKGTKTFSYSKQLKIDAQADKFCRSQERCIWRDKNQHHNLKDPAPGEGLDYFYATAQPGTWKLPRLCIGYGDRIKTRRLKMDIRLFGSYPSTITPSACRSLQRPVSTALFSVDLTV